MSLRSAPRNALTAPAGARQVDPNEPRDRPDFDAPASKMKEVGNLVPSGTPPAEPHPDFRRNHPDFDAPVEKQLEAGNLRGKVRHVQRTLGAAPGAGRGTEWAAAAAAASRPARVAAVRGGARARARLPRRAAPAPPADR